MQFKDDVIAFTQNGVGFKVTYLRDEKHKDVIYPAVLEADGEEANQRLADLVSLIKDQMNLTRYNFGGGPRDYSFTTTLAQHPSFPEMIYQGSSNPGEPWSRIIFYTNVARDILEKMVAAAKDKDELKPATTAPKPSMMINY
jgi:hypothetical protein